MSSHGNISMRTPVIKLLAASSPSCIFSKVPAHAVAQLQQIGLDLYSKLVTSMRVFALLSYHCVIITFACSVIKLFNVDMLYCVCPSEPPSMDAQIRLTLYLK